MRPKLYILVSTDARWERRTGQYHSDLCQHTTVTAGTQRADDKAPCFCPYLHLNCELNLKPSSATLLTFCLSNLILTPTGRDDIRFWLG